jgi:hypothetical protein
MSPETVEFIGLQKVSGWNACRGGTASATTRATVSRYLSGKLPVPRNMMELFKFVIAALDPGALAAGNSTEGDECGRLGAEND